MGTIAEKLNYTKTNLQDIYNKLKSLGYNIQ